MSEQSPPLILKQYAILWDFDGIIVDTGEYHYSAWLKTFRELGKTLTPEEFRNTFGMNNTDILEILLDKKPDQYTLMDISNRKEELFRESIKGKAELLPGVLKWLIRFKEMGAKQAIASSAPPENIHALVNELCIQQYFDEIVSGFDLPGKPRPDVFLEAAKKIGAKPSYCTVIEDAIVGVEGAINAGMKCIAVTSTNSAATLGKADIVISSLSDLNDRLLLSLVT